jgi:hypothetical protein
VSIPKKERLYFIADKDNKTISVKNGAIVKDAQPTPLEDNPEGWQNIEIAFGTNQKYFSLQRSFSVPLKFVNDGAQILRYYTYKGKGYEEELYTLILRWNEANGRHELEYKGRNDLTKFSDEHNTGVTTNLIEGGLLSLINANDGVTYEIPCDSSNPSAIKVLFDGITLYDKLNYSGFEIEISQGYYTSPITYLNNEGDSVGLEFGSQAIEELPGPSPTDFKNYATTSNNYMVKATRPTPTVIKGKFSYTVTKVGSIQTTADLFILTTNAAGDVNSQIFISKVMPVDIVGNKYTYPINVTLNLLPEEKVFLATNVRHPGFGEYSITCNEQDTKIDINTTTINDNSFAYALRPIDLLKQIISKLSNGKYTANSNFFAANNNIVTTCGEALRGLIDTTTGNLKAVIKTSLQDFYNSYRSLYPSAGFLAAKVINDVLWIEPATDFYNDLTQVFNLGDVAKLKTEVADEYIYNSIKTGFPVQQYDERNGKYEFNGTSEWKAPNTVNKELNLVTKYRGDSYGMEFIRGKLNNKDTTDAKSDNENFLIVISDDKFTVTTDIYADGQLNFFFFNGDQFDNYLNVGDKFSFANSLVNTGVYTVKSKVDAINGINYFVYETVISEVLNGAILNNDVFKLSRPAYTRLDGLPAGMPTTGPGAVFNTEISPKRQLLAYSNFIRSFLYQLPGEKITFQTSDKNKELVTELNGVTIAEKADITVSTLLKPLFLNYWVDFTTQVPYTFAQIMSGIVTGNVKFNYNGFTLYGMVIGEMKCKPVTSEAQEWKLLASPLNSLDTLYQLSQEGLYISDGMNNTARVSVINPVHFVYYNKVLNAKYKYKDIFDDWVHHRNDQFAVQPQYLQKWQTTDEIRLQFITMGIGQLDLTVYDCDAKVVNTYSSYPVSDPAVLLPHVLHQIDIELTTFLEGNYLFAVRSDNKVLMISEWQSIMEYQPDTYLIEYYNTRNKLNGYFAQYRPMIRVEAMFATEVPDGSSVDYEDEPRDLQTLSFGTFTRKKIYFGMPWGIPEYLAITLNNITYLNRVKIEDTYYTRPSESKLDGVERNGYPLNYYTLDLRKADSNQDFVVTDDGIEPEAGAIYTLDSEAFGRGPGVTQIEIYE